MFIFYCLLWRFQIKYSRQTKFLRNKYIKLNDIIIYQNKIIQDLKGDNIKLNDKINGLFKNIDNAHIIQSNKIDNIISNNTINSSNINNSIVLINNNTEIDSID